MDRRSFLKTAAGSVSGSFVVGGVGGAAVGAGGLAIWERRDLGQRSFAQQGEDLIVQQILTQIGIGKPTYLDVGAYDPILNSNTYLLYRDGAHGVLVEPNPALAGRLRRVRPRDVTLNAGVGVAAEASADYYVIAGPSQGLFNTFSKKDAELLQADSKGVHTIEKVIKMPLLGINAIMAEHLGGAPSFLSIDTEGLDLDILRSLDFDRYRPDVICVETLDLGTDVVDLEILGFLASKRYSVRGATWVNTIFVDDRHLSQPGPLGGPPRGRTGSAAPR